MTKMARVQVNAAYGRHAATQVTGLENKLKASMKAVIKEDWLGANEDEQFRAGVLGVLLDVGVDSEDGRLIARSLEAVTKFSAALEAMQAGLRVDFASALPIAGDKVVPLLALWHEVKERS